MDILIDYVGKRFVDINNNQVIYETLPPNTNIIWDGKIIKVTGSKGRPTNEWVKIHADFNMAKTLKKLKKEENIFLSYVPKHKYKFEINDFTSTLYIDDLPFDPTTKNILALDVEEFVYGISPVVVDKIYPLLFDLYKQGADPRWKKYSAIIRKEEQPKVYKNGESAMPSTVVAFIHLCLCFKNKFNKSDGKLVTEKFGEDALQKTDTQEYRRYAWQLGLYVLQQTRNEMDSKGYTNNKPGDYVLYSLKELKPQQIACRDVILTDAEFDAIKKRHSYKCFTCGSVEGQPHNNEPSCITILEQGHINPVEKLSDTNCVPQCKLCNATYKNNYLMEVSDTGKLGIFLDKKFMKSKYQQKDLEKLFLDVTIDTYKK